MKHKDEEQVEVSLIPEIRQQERHLSQELKAAHTEAERVVQQAQNKAEAALQKIQAEFNASVDQLCEQEIQSLHAFQEARRIQIHDSLRDFEKQAEARLPVALQYIMTLVLPEGKA